MNKIVRIRTAEELPELWYDGSPIGVADIEAQKSLLERFPHAFIVNDDPSDDVYKEVKKLSDGLIITNLSHYFKERFIEL